MNKNCLHCGKPFRIRPHQVDVLYCCSRACSYAHRTRDERDRYTEKVVRGGANECWSWRGSKNTDGYGVMRVRRDGRWAMAMAHRLALEYSGTDVPKDKLVLHSCDAPECCNPAHLRVGTHQENMRDMTSRDRAARGHSGPRPSGDNHYSRREPWRLARGERNGARTKPENLPRGDAHWSRRAPELVARGERSGTSKLTEEVVRTIRTRYAAGERSDQIAADLGLPYATVWGVAKGRSWRHLL